MEVGPSIDGNLDDAVWAGAEVIEGFVQTVPSEGTPATEKTEVRILSDGRMLYFGVRLLDRQPDRLIALKMRRDVGLQSEDRFTIALAPFRNSRSGYMFQVNPVGARTDFLVEDQAVLRNWDGIWYAKTKIDARGWTLEVGIPFKTLNFDPASDVWGMNLLRAIRRRNEVVRWPAADLDVSFVNFAQAGQLAGMRGSEQGLGLDLVPALSIRYVDDPGDPVTGLGGRRSVRASPSGEIFVRVTPRVTAVVTANTDFGETEVDARQINLTRFSLLFPEKRAFFLQDALLFDFSDRSGGANARPFFSRRIGLDASGDPVRILAGVKLTGRVGRFNLGLLDVQTESHAGVASRNLAVGRLSYNLGEESKVGVIATHGDPQSDSENRLLGADLLLRSSRLWENQSVVGRAWFQNTGTAPHSNAFGLSIAYPNDRWNGSLGFLQVERNYFPALGRVVRAGIRQYRGDLRFRLRPQRVRRVDTQVAFSLIADASDRLESGAVTWSLLSIESHLGDSATLRYRRRYERLESPFEVSSEVFIPADRYEFDQASVLLALSPARSLSGSIEVGGGSFFSGRRLDVVPELVWRPNRYGVLSLRYRHSQVWLPRGCRTDPARVLQRCEFTAQLLRVGFLLAFSPDASWGTSLQWDSNSDSIGIQTRLRWIIRPGREVVAVFNQDISELDRSAHRGRSELIAKVSWTLRF